MFLLFNDHYRLCFVVKVDREKQEIVIDEYLENVTVEELQVN